MIFIEVKNNAGFKWYVNKNILAKGFLFDEEGNFYRNDEISSFFKDVGSFEDFKHKLQVANGSFAVIIKNGGQIYAAVDTLRSIPLFYIKHNGTFFISDDAWHIIRKVNLRELDDIGVSEFLLSGYTIGNYTLFEDLQQIQAGQYLYYNDETKELKLDFYYKHLHADYLVLDNSRYFERLDSIYKNVFSRLIESVEGRTIVIPLSGGYDSRSIAAMLKSLSYENVICYTYGRPESFEVQTSERVAKKLGYKWYFVNYAEKMEWFKLVRDENYLFFASNAASLPHIQEYIAVSSLKNKLLVPEDAIFVPGFCGDLLGGSYVPHEIISGRVQLLFKEGIEDYIFHRYFNLDNKISFEHIPIIKKRISEELFKLGSDGIKNISDFDSAAEAFFTNHKVAKFVVNALRPYEYFGYEWRMPLWDKELIEFWYYVPIDKRIGKNKLYDEYLFNRLFEPFNIGFMKKPKLLNNVLNLYGGSILGKQLVRIAIEIYKFIKKKSRGDFNAFSNLYMICSNELSKKVRSLPSPQNINSIFALWFLLIFLKNHLNKKMA